MPPNRRLVTSESVTAGHPDKIADQISDAILDAILHDDPCARVACETLVTTGMVLVAGEVTTDTYVEIPRIVRETLLRIGYDKSDYGIDGNTCAVLTTLDLQSEEISKAVTEVGGAGDQGMMYGFACDDTPELMPLPIATAHRLTKGLAQARSNGDITWLRPDGKAQVTFEYSDDWKPLAVKAVVVSAQHDGNGKEGITDTQKEELLSKVIQPALPPDYYETLEIAPRDTRKSCDSSNTCCHINPSGVFTLGGPHADAGLTGRKIIVDTYGGVGRHGGGAFSGKDATKVDRSGAYAARWAAKNVVAAGLASRCEVQLAYAIGKPDPVQVYVDTFGTGSVPDGKLSKAVEKVFDFTPNGIICRLGLRSPIFLKTATYGHFGRSPKDGHFGWERTDRTVELADALRC